MPPTQKPPFRGQFKGPQIYGQPLALPQATTLPASAVNATGGTLNGAVNPQGSAATWWFVWGTTTAYGNTTSATSAGSGVLPTTVSTVLTGLTTGTTYHFAVVVSSAAGTVTGFDLSFVAQVPSVVTDANNPLTLVGLPTVAIPHFQAPFTFTTFGANVVEQDSLGEVFSCVQNIATCPTGACPELPTFGFPDLVFGQAPLDPTPALAALKRWEPRADEKAIVQAIDDAGDQWQLALTTSTIASGDDGYVPPLQSSTAGAADTFGVVAPRQVTREAAHEIANARLLGR